MSMDYSWLFDPQMSHRSGMGNGWKTTTNKNQPVSNYGGVAQNATLGKHMVKQCFAHTAGQEWMVKTMRLIDADALEKAIYEWMPKDQSTWMDSDLPPIDNLVVSIMMTIQEQPAIDAVPRWIPCEDRLPEPNLAVLGYAPKFDNIFAVYYDSVCGWMTWDPVHDNPFPSFQGEIVAWMPLPEPYKGERKDDETD